MLLDINNAKGVETERCLGFDLFGAFNYIKAMKLLVFILTILFSYSVFADCCNSVEFEENCQIETLREKACSDADHSSTEHNVSHCSFSCASKIIKKQTSITAPFVSYASIEFYPCVQSLKGITVSPALRPPIG